jgi:hypothetical protein
VMYLDGSKAPVTVEQNIASLLLHKIRVCTKKHGR